MIHIFLVVSINNNINFMNNSDEILIQSFAIVLQFQDRSIDVVNNQDRFNLFLHNLSQDGLVGTQMPSTQSKMTKAPSETFKAAVTSEKKSMCPGESIKLNKQGSVLPDSFKSYLQYIEILVEFIVSVFKFTNTIFRDNASLANQRVSKGSLSIFEAGDN
ncbi:hypothetical protein ABPG72_010449 [Tetrahymena utriculariae]